MGKRKRELKAQIQELERINFQLVNENEFLQDAIKTHNKNHLEKIKGLTYSDLKALHKHIIETMKNQIA